jgi:hypothetical protein
MAANGKAIAEHTTRQVRVVFIFLSSGWRSLSYVSAATGFGVTKRAAPVA